MTVPAAARKAGPFNGNGSTTSFPFTFKVFTDEDIEVVFANASGVESVLTLDSDYSVSLNADQDADPGGTVTYPISGAALASGQKLSIAGALAYEQETDIPTGGNFNPTVLENALDKLSMQTQQLAEGLERAAKLPITNAGDAEALVEDLVRLADSADNIDTVVDNLADITTVADDLNEGVSEINTVANAIANVNAVGNNISNVNTVAGISANVTTVAGIAANVTTVAGIAANVTSVAGNTTNINAVAGNATNINAVNANKTNIDTAATNIAAIIDAPNQATAAAASAAAAAASAASGMYSAVQDKSADYTVVAGDAGDLIRVTTTGGARTITLPAISAVSDGFKVAIVKWTGDTNGVTVARSGSDTINGATSYAIGSQYNSATFVADAETSQWFAAASGLGSTNVIVDSFNGTSSQTAFTLSGDPGTENNTQVFVGGVYQEKDTYSVSGTALTFSSAPPAGTSNIEVVWTQPLPVGVPGNDTVSTAKLQANAVTYAKMQNVSAGKVLGRDTSGSGVVQELPIAVDTSGNMGIGTSSPAFISGSYSGLHINSPTGTSLHLTNDTVGTTGSDGLDINYDTSGNASYINRETSGYQRWYTGGSERARIDSSGNYGVGITAPLARVHGRAASGEAARFQTNGSTAFAPTVTIRNEADGNSYITQLNLLGQNAAGTDQIAFIASQTNSSGYTPNLIFGAKDASNNYAERARIDSSGNLIVGDTATISSLIRLSVKSASGADVAEFRATTNDKKIIFRNSGETNVGNINIGASATSYNTSSDYRLKENIAPMSGALAKVAQLNPVTYKWKADGSDGQGFIAHELQAVVPDAVVGEKDATEIQRYEISPAVPATFDDEGNELTPAVEAVIGEREVPVYQGIDTSFLVATLTAAIQEQQAIIQSLTQRIEALEGN